MTGSTTIAALATVLAVLGAAARWAPARGRPVTPRSGALLRWAPLRLGRTTHTPSEEDVAAWCEHLARAVRSGASLTTAVADASAAHVAMAPVIEPIVQQVRRGRSLLDAAAPAAGDAATPAGLALTVLRASARFGGPAAAPLERAAATLRTRAAIRDEQRAQSAQARLSARVLTLVPIAMLALLATTDEKVRASIGTPAGSAAVVAGAALNGLGAWWMRRIVGGRHP